MHEQGYVGAARRRQAQCLTGPLEASRNVAICCSRASPRPANDGIGRAAVHAGRALQVRDLEGDALVLRALGGELRRAEVVPAVAQVRVAVQAARDREELGARRSRRLVAVKPSFFAQAGTWPTISEPSASFAVAPL